MILKKLKDKISQEWSKIYRELSNSEESVYSYNRRDLMGNMDGLVRALNIIDTCKKETQLYEEMIDVTDQDSKESDYLIRTSVYKNKIIQSLESIIKQINKDIEKAVENEDYRGATEKRDIRVGLKIAIKNIKHNC